MRDALNSLWSKHTGQPIDRIKNDTERDYFMGPGEAKEYGLVDEVIVHLLPVVLGAGVPFSPGSGRIDLELVERRASGPTTTMHFRVKR